MSDPSAEVWISVIPIPLLTSLVIRSRVSLLTLFFGSLITVLPISSGLA